MSTIWVVRSGDRDDGSLILFDDVNKAKEHAERVWSARLGWDRAKNEQPAQWKRYESMRQWELERALYGGCRHGDRGTQR